MVDVKKCAVCGSPVTTQKTGAKYCGEKCKLKANKAQAKERRMVAKILAKEKAEQEANAERPPGIADIAKMARRAGMSYGQYVLKMGL